MDIGVLKKKLSTYRTDKGRLKNVSDELLIEILLAWENWPESAHSFYKAIGTNHKSFASLLGKAKRLKRDGYDMSGFEEIKVESGSLSTNTHKIELVWDNNRLIRFDSVDLIVDFLKKAA